MTYPGDRKYTKDHEWVRVEGDTATVGITDYAQNQLGDVVYVELPKPGQKVVARYEGLPTGPMQVAVSFK